MSDTFWWVSWVLVAIVVIGWYLSYTAARLDRLHVRLKGTLAALDAQLVRRAEAALEVAHAGVLDAATSIILATAAAEALESSIEDDRIDEAVQSDLTEALEVSLSPETVALIRAGSATEREFLDRLCAAGTRVQLARRFHNDAVTDVRRVRRQTLVRTFRLAGYTPMPRTVEFDDALPDALGAQAS